MPKFKGSREQNEHLNHIGCSYRFESFPSHAAIKSNPKEPPKAGPVHCDFIDSEGEKIATGYGNNHHDAFENGFAKIRAVGKPKTKGELLAELNAAKAQLASMGKSVATETPAKTTSRGRGRPPGSKNKPKSDTESQDDEGAGNTTEIGRAHV